MTRQIKRTVRTSTAIGLLMATAPAGATLADESGWDLLKSIGLEEIVTAESYEVRKSFPARLTEPVEDFALTGFVVPLWEEGEIRNFILVSDMGFCPFCGEPEHGTAVQVELDDPLALEEGTRITVSGLLEPITDPETMQTVRLVRAMVAG